MSAVGGVLKVLTTRGSDAVDPPLFFAVMTKVYSVAAFSEVNVAELLVCEEGIAIVPFNV